MKNKLDKFKGQMLKNEAKSFTMGGDGTGTETNTSKYTSTMSYFNGSCVADTSRDGDFYSNC